jgi:hypothetical protein
MRTLLNWVAICVKFGQGSIGAWTISMLGSDKARGYCLELICADFLAGANAESGDTKCLRLALDRLFGLLPCAEQQDFIASLSVVHEKQTPATSA